MHKLKIKYYKGLGTSTAKEAKEYFSDLGQHKIQFEYVDQEDEEVIELAFSKKNQMADRRKDWLTTYDVKTTYIDHTESLLRYKDFVNKELILFSVADCARSIPCLCDGLKPGQRKIMFSCFKRKLKAEIKVAQLSGYVSEHSAYHHGEVSLQQTIVTLAQNFVGANNINLLLPIGQFGTRNQGGSEAASARYIFTNVAPVTRHIFHEMDEAVLEFLEEEGQSIEPTYYLPTLPLVLVNGAQGIGTGWATTIPQHNPREIVRQLKNMMRGGNPEKMVPWYKGFQGTIEAKPDGKGFTVTGVYTVLSDTELEITELPIHKWTRDYKNFLEELATKEEITEIREYHMENRVHFVLEVPKLREIEAKEGGILKKFKLQGSIASTNYVLFNKDHRIVRYADEISIMSEFFALRSDLYHKRKEYMLSKLQKEYEILLNKVKFISAVIAEPAGIKINKVKKRLILRQCQEFGLKTMTELNKILKENKSLTLKKPESDGEEEAKEEEEEVGEIPQKEYDYLLTMPLWSLTEEKVEELIRQMN